VRELFAMMRSFPRARWAALASILVLTFLSGGWLLRPRPSAEGGIYEQARLFEGVVGAIPRRRSGRRSGQPAADRLAPRSKAGC
jgi:hypothetical protein